MKKLAKILFLILLLSALRYPLNAANAAVPHLISYQGRLTDSEDQPIDGEEDITFEIYDAAGGGTRLWGETHTGVLVEEGVFSVILGSQAALNLAFDKDYYLQIIVGDDPMATRQWITSAGYSMRAETADDADKLDGKHASSFVNVSENQTISGAKTITAASPVTPDSNTLYKDNLIKAWVKVRAGPSTSIVDEFNVASVQRTAQGYYTINWKRPFANADYTVVTTYSMNHPGASLGNYTYSQTTNSIKLYFVYPTVGQWDPESFSLIAIGDQ